MSQSPYIPILWLLYEQNPDWKHWIARGDAEPPIEILARQVRETLRMRANIESLVLKIKSMAGNGIDIDDPTIH